MIEVLSPGTRANDRGRKLQMFAHYGVPEYWIVDCWSRSVIIFHPEEDTLKEVTRIRQTDVLESPIFPGLSLKLSDIFTDDVNAFLT